jgi:hypothetical protein
VADRGNQTIRKIVISTGVAAKVETSQVRSVTTKVDANGIVIQEETAWAVGQDLAPPLGQQRGTVGIQGRGSGSLVAHMIFGN